MHCGPMHRENHNVLCNNMWSRSARNRRSRHRALPLFEVIPQTAAALSFLPPLERLVCRKQNAFFHHPNGFRKGRQMIPKSVSSVNRIYWIILNEHSVGVREFGLEPIENAELIDSFTRIVLFSRSLSPR